MKYLLLSALFLVTGCGYCSVDNTAVAQVKKVAHNTPILCNNYIDTDLSFGVLRNGVGSISQQDLWMYVPDQSLADTLTKAADAGLLVRVTYSEKRWRWCVEELMVTKVEILK